jgi:4-amino-4-deoxy-L-arabinose transferase-like glycosyltransferase
MTLSCSEIVGNVLPEEPCWQQTVARCGRWNVRSWQGFAVIVLLAIILRVHGLGDRSFHGDELLSISIGSSKNIVEQQRVTQPAWHPPLHYAIPHLLYLAGATTEVQWRSIGALSGVLMAMVSFLIPFVWGAGRVGFVAGLLTASSPMAVLFSQTVRWHPLVGCMLAVGALGLVVAVRRDRFWGWLLAAASFALAFHTVYMAGIPALIMLAVAFFHVRHNRKSLKGFVSAAMLMMLATVPLSHVVMRWLQPGVLHWEPVRSVFGGAGKLLVMLQNLTVGPTVMPWNWLIMVPATVLLCILSWKFATTRYFEVAQLRRSVVAVFVPCLLVPLLAPLTASSRYWLLLLVPVHIGLAGGMVAIMSPWLRRLACLSLALLMGYGLANLYGHRHYHYQYQELIDDWRGLAEVTRRMTEPGDEVWSVMKPFLYYYGVDALNVYQWYYEPDAAARHLRVAKPKRVLLQYSPLSDWEVIDFSRMAEVIGAELSRHGFERKFHSLYGYDPDAAIKRRYMRGRDFPHYRHVLEVWVPMH